ncbi:kelch-like protein 6 [Drosophila tropicalis]|uniref:kelch-like protein 6 n=1 Tax=Drosophila tropicalis TaxID=46794 RepID=UPI0035ABF5B0
MNCKLRRLDLLRNGNKLPKSDCELHVWYGDKAKRCFRQFHCHRIMLASASEVFENLINAPDFEQNKRVINVDDASPNAYEALLLYMYTYEVCDAINLDMYSELVYLATKYKIYDFVAGFIEKLANQDWPIKTVLKLFHLANKHSSPTIMDLVAKKILPIATQVLNDNSFLHLRVDELKALITILKEQQIVSDEDLLKALKKYQISNNLRYNNMEVFQQFVEVTQLFGEVLFEIDGTLAVKHSDMDQEQQSSSARASKR